MVTEQSFIAFKKSTYSSFYVISSEEQKLNVVVLIIFAHEGNNIPESIQLVNYLNEWKEFLPKVIYYNKHSYLY